jgi:WD40 repeat protein
VKFPFRGLCAGVMFCAVWTCAGSTPEPPVTAAAFVPGEGALVTGSQAGLIVRPWPALKPSPGIETKLANIHDLRFSPDGSILLAAGGSPGESGEIELYRWPEGELLGRIEAHDDLVYAVAWSPDGRLFATAGGDGLCRVFDAARRQEIHVLRGHSKALHAVACIGESDLLATAGADQTIRIWNARTGQPVGSFNNHTDAVVGLAARPAADSGPPMLASISADRTVRFWQPTIGRMVRFVRLPDAPLDLAWEHDGRYLRVSTTGGHVHRIDPESAAIVASLRPLEGWAYTLALSPTGRGAAVAGAGGRIVALD